MEVKTPGDGTPAVVRPWLSVLDRHGVSAIFSLAFIAFAVWTGKQLVPIWIDGMKAAQVAEGKKAEAMAEMAKAMKDLQVGQANMPDSVASRLSM